MCSIIQCNLSAPRSPPTLLASEEVKRLLGSDGQTDREREIKREREKERKGERETEKDRQRDRLGEKERKRKRQR